MYVCVYVYMYYVCVYIYIDIDMLVSLQDQVFKFCNFFCLSFERLWVKGSATSITCTLLLLLLL